MSMMRVQKSSFFEQKVHQNGGEVEIWFKEIVIETILKTLPAETGKGSN